MVIIGHPVRQVTVALSGCDGSNSQPKAPRGCGRKTILTVEGQGMGFAGLLVSRLKLVMKVALAADTELRHCHERY